MTKRTKQEPEYWVQSRIQPTMIVGAEDEVKRGKSWATEIAASWTRDCRILLFR